MGSPGLTSVKLGSGVAVTSGVADGDSTDPQKKHRSIVVTKQPREIDRSDKQLAEFMLYSILLHVIS